MFNYKNVKLTKLQNMMKKRGWHGIAYIHDTVFVFGGSENCSDSWKPKIS